MTDLEVASVKEMPHVRDRRGIGLSSFRSLTIVVALLVLIVGMSIAEPSFRTVSNFKEILISASIIAVLSVGQAIVIISGNIDLSIGSIVGLTAFVTGLLLRNGWSLPMAILFAIAIGAALGLGNGVLVGVGAAPAIVVTLGTLNVYRGILLAIAGGKAINAYDVPRSYLDIASQSVAGVPKLVLIAGAVVLLGALLMRFRPAGRKIYAMGGNPAGATILGIPTLRLTLGVFVLSGFIAGGAGVLWGAEYATVQSGAATGLELTVITAVVVGGVNVFGGAGNVIGAAAGAVLLSTVSDSLTLLQASPFWLGAIQGALILGAIVTDASVSRYLRRFGVSNRRSS